MFSEAYGQCGAGGNWCQVVTDMNLLSSHSPVIFKDKSGTLQCAVWSVSMGATSRVMVNRTSLCHGVLAGIYLSNINHSNSERDLIMLGVPARTY